MRVTAIWIIETLKVSKMGTNFYWKAAAADPLSVFGDIHIGKRSGGWSFSFHGLKYPGAPAQAREVEVDNAGLSVSMQIPATPALEVVSWQDWKALISRARSTITSEDQDALSVADFIEGIENRLHPVKGSWGPDKCKLHNHFDSLVAEQGRYGPVNREQDWKDSEGYSFSMNVFS